MSVKNLLKIANKIENKLKFSIAGDRVTELFNYFTKHTSEIYKSLPSNLTDGENLFYQQISNAACKNPNNPQKMMDIYRGRMQNIASQVYDKFDARDMRGHNLNELLKKIQTRSYEIYKVVWSAYHAALELNEDPLSFAREFDVDGSAKSLIKGTIPGRKDLGTPKHWAGPPHELP